MGRTLLRANSRRRIRRRSRPCPQFCSCCDDNSNIKKSSASSLHKKREPAKNQNSGRILRSTKRTPTVKVNQRNVQKSIRLKRVSRSITNGIFNSHLNKVLVNVTRLSEDVLNILSEFGSICACEVDPGSTRCHGNPRSEFAKTPYLRTPVRRLRSTPIVPVDRHTPSSVMDRLRVLNADWRSSTYPMIDNPSISSKAPENIPLPGISMKTLFLQNLSICKKAQNDESSKENVKVPQSGIRPGGDLQLRKDIKDSTLNAADCKSSLKLTKPCLPVPREPAATGKCAMSKMILPSLPSKMPTPSSQFIWPKNQHRRPTILGPKPMRANSKIVNAENASNMNLNFVPYKSLLNGSTRRINANFNHTKLPMTMSRGVSPHKSDSKGKGVVKESSKRSITTDMPRDKPLGVGDSGITPKKQKIQGITRSSATTPRTNDISTSKNPPGKTPVYTIVLSDSSDDEHSYVLVDDAVPPKPAVAHSNTGKKKPLPKRKSASKVLGGRKNSRATVSLRKQHSDESSDENIKHSKPKVQVKKAIQPKKSSVKKKLKAKALLVDSESEEYSSSDSEPKVVETPARRVRGNWKGGCRSCPGCKIDVPRKQQPKRVPSRERVRPKRTSHRTYSDSSIEIINVIPRKDRRLPKPESPPPVIIHGLTSSNDSLDDIEDEQSLGHGRTALVFVAEPPGCEVSDEKTPPPAGNTGNRTNPERVAGTNLLLRKSEGTNLPQTDPPPVAPINDGKPTNDSSHNLLEQQQHAYETDQSVLRITDAPCSQENSINVEIRQPDDLATPCHNVDTTKCVPNVDSGVNDESGTQRSGKSDDSQSKTSMHRIASSSPGDSERSHIDVDKSQCSEECGDINILTEEEHPSCESIDSSIAVENLDSHDYSGSNCSSLSSLRCNELCNQGGIEKGQDHGPDISSQPSELEECKTSSEEHHEVSVEADSQKPNDCIVLANALDKVDGVIDDVRTSLECHIPCKEEPVLENGLVQNSRTREVSQAIPSPDGMQTLQCELTSDVLSFVSNDCTDASPGESSIVSNFPAHGNMCEGATTGNHIVNVPNVVLNRSIMPFSEFGSLPQGDVTEKNDLGQPCKNGEVSYSSYALQDRDSHCTFGFPCTSIGSQEASSVSTTAALRDCVPDTVVTDVGCGMSLGSDDVLKHTDHLNDPSSGINQYIDNNCNVATNCEHQLPDNRTPSQESISNDLSLLLDDIVKSVKLDNREVIIKKVNFKSSETMGEREVATEPGSLDESAAIAKELNILIHLNPRLMIRKLPLSNDGNSAQDIHLPEDNVLNNHQVPEVRRCNTPDLTTPSKIFYEHKGYPSPIRRLNPGVLSVIKYNELEIYNDEPSLNDPPETDLVECVSSKGVRFALNPENLSAIDDFLKVRPPEGDLRVAFSSTTKEVDSNHTVDDFIIDNDEPPLNPSPLKRSKHPSYIPENEEDLEDLVIDNDAPPLNETAEAVIGVKPVPNDSDCLIISSDDEVCTSSVANSLLGMNPEVKVSAITPNKKLPRLKKKLFRIRRSSALDSVKNSTRHIKENLNNRLKLPRLEPLGFSRVVNQKLFDAGETEIPVDDVLCEVVVNDCGIPTKRQSSGKPLPSFQGSKYQLNVLAENPVGMSSVQSSVDLSGNQEGSCGDVSQIGSTDQVTYEAGDFDFLDDDIINEVVIDDSTLGSINQPSWKPHPKIQGCRETLLQPQVFDLHGQPLKLNHGHSRYPGSANSSIGDTISSSKISFDLSKTFPDNSATECMNISDSDTLTASEGEGDVIMISSPSQPRSPVDEKKVAIYKNGCETKDASHIAISDSDDDDLIEVSAPDSSTQMNRTRNFKPSIPKGTLVRTVPDGNGGYYCVLVVPRNQCSLDS